MKALRFLGLLAFVSACPAASEDDGGSGTTGSDTTGGTFMASGDGLDATGVEGAQCDPYSQDCPDGFKCQPPLPVPPGRPAECVSVPAEPIGLDGDCASGPDSTDDCDIGLICLPVDVEKKLGTCLALCSGSSDAPECPDDTVCISNLDPFVVCFPLCHPFDDPCGNGLNCAPPLDGWQFFCTGVVPEAGGPGDPCMTPGFCLPGSTCVEAALVPGCTDQSCCTEYCDPNDDSFTCAFADEGQECQPWAADPPPGFDNVGVCALPV